MVDGPEFLIGEMRVQTTREEILFLSSAASQKNETRAISRGQLWLLDLTPEDDALVLQQRVLGDQVSPATLCVCEDASDKCRRHGFLPLLDVQANTGDNPFPEKSDDLNHSEVESKCVCELTSLLAGLGAVGRAIAKNPNG